VRLSRITSRRLGYGVAIFFAVLLVYCVNLNSLYGSDHPTSFLELDYSIYAHHSFALGPVATNSSSPCSRFQSVDVFAYRGSCFSALAPGAALMALPFVAAGFMLDGHFTVFGDAMLLSEFFVALMNAVAVLFVYKLGRLYFKEATSALLAFAYAFSTISWPFATFYFQNDVSATFAVIAAYLVLLSARRGGDTSSLVLGGLVVGAAMTVDYVNAALLPVLLIFLILDSREKSLSLRSRSAIPFVLASLLGVLAIVAYNFGSFGQAWVTSEQLYLNSPTFFGYFSTPIYSGLILNLITPFRGIFLFSPLLTLGALGLRRMTEKASATRREGFLLFAVFLALFLPYCAWYEPSGGLSFGPRFVIASLPFLLLPAGYLVEQGGRFTYAFAYLLYSAGVVINGLAATTTALAGGTGWLTSPFLGTTVPLLTNGCQGTPAPCLDQWWSGSLGSFRWAGVMLVLAFALLLPLAVRYMSSPSRRRRVDLPPEPAAPPTSAGTSADDGEAPVKNAASPFTGAGRLPRDNAAPPSPPLRPLPPRIGPRTPCSRSKARR
jgi:Na+-transporting methylmalonyl-CoA/oxaloacetate decarboxylase gamma subunit